MKTRALTRLSIASLLACSSFVAFAQADVSTTRAEQNVQRDINQDQRIQNGLKDGSLTTREAAKLEKKEAKIDRMEANAMKDGVITNKEDARINAEQNAASRAIYNQRHDAQTGNPNSVSSQRMQADVQRNINQETRIKHGLENGSLTTQEAGQLERGQARNSRMEARAGRDGFVGAGEQRRIQAAENRNSERIFNKKHNQRHQ